MDDSIELRKPAPHSQRFVSSLLLLAAAMLVGMTIYEWLKQLLFPDITLWQSHIVTILFSTAVATVAGFLFCASTQTSNGSSPTRSPSAHAPKSSRSG